MRRRSMINDDGPFLRGTVVYNECNVGDVALYDRENDCKVIVDINNPAQKFPLSQYVPISVIVIPSSHDVYGTGEAAGISLTYMETNGRGVMCWGETNVNISTLNDYDKVATNGTCNNLTEEISSTRFDGYLPSDKFNKTQCLHDKNTFYDKDTDVDACPSPYLTDGSRNPMYYQTTSPSSTYNALSDFNGKKNTNNIINYRGKKDYSSWIPDYKTGKDYPAASSCDMYVTEGTQQGEWYLPAAGEIGYVMARFNIINNSLNILKPYVDVSGFPVAAYIWTSTEMSVGYAACLRCFNGNIGGLSDNGNRFNKTHVHDAFAFLRISPVNNT